MSGCARPGRAIEDPITIESQARTRPGRMPGDQSGRL